MSIGEAVVQKVYQLMGLDANWSTPSPGSPGFSWWGHRLEQRVWADPEQDDDGVSYPDLCRNGVLARCACQSGAGRGGGVAERGGDAQLVPLPPGGGEALPSLLGLCP